MRVSGNMPDIDMIGVYLTTAIVAVLAAYYAMKYTAMKRYAKEEAIERAERERKRRETAK